MVEVEGALNGETAVVDQLTVLNLSFDKVIADGHRDMIVTFGIGFLLLAIDELCFAINIKHDILDWDIGTLIIDVSLHWERRDILEVYVISRDAGWAYKHRRRIGIEFVNA